jgi:hypothetical protein
MNRSVLGLTRFGLPPDAPACLTHAEADSPVPTWEQVTRTSEGSACNPGELALHVWRIVGGAGVEQAARERWESFPPNYRRSIGLIIDKVSNEGWLDAIGSIEGWPYDGGFQFWPQRTRRGDLAEILDGKARRDGVYVRCNLRDGLFAAISGWNHPAWSESWMETDTPAASLHVGLLRDGRAELHLDAFNPLFTNGAESSEIAGLPLIGFFNHRLFRLHRRWEQSSYGAAARRSANYYHLMRGRVPLSF